MKRFLRDFKIGFAIGFLFCLWPLVMGTFILAQSTTNVTGTVQDPNSNLYANGTVSASIVLASGQPLPPGVPASGSIGPFPTTNLGTFSVSVTSPQTWIFTVCAPPLNLGPTVNPTPIQICFSSPPIAISGGTLDISTNLNAVAKILGPKQATSGCAVAGAVNTLQKTNGSGCAASSAADDAAGVHFKGPNPYVDVTQFFARAVNPNGTPAIPGITANCTNGQSTFPISSASLFQNNDGVVIFGCGAPHSMSTPGAPTVVPVIAQLGTHTLITTTSAPVGATTYNYYIMARDRSGGLTALSAVGSTTTGAASLGLQTVNITSESRSGQVVTNTVGSHGFLNGCDGSNPLCGEIFIGGGNGLTDATFRGWFNINNVANGTTFSYAGPSDTALGASTSATGGTVGWYNANKVTWSAVTPANSAVYYGIYSDRAVPGTCKLIGVSWALSSSGTQDLEYDDFGSPFEDNQQFPFIFPTSFSCASPPAATSDSLSSTIVSGATTTTLTLANPAGTTISGQTILFDDAPTFLAAANSIANKQGALVIPCDNSGNQFVINSWLQLNGNNYGLSHCGPLYLNDTIEITGLGNNGTRWVGQYKAFPSAFGSSPSAQWSNFPQISVNGAHPGLYFSGQQFGLHVEGINFNPIPVNGALDILADGGFNQTFEWINFSSGSGSNDYISQGLQLRTNPGQSNGNVTLDYVGFSTGGGSDAASHTPTFYCRSCGITSIPHSYSIHRGMMNTGGPTQVGIGGVAYINGGGTPFLTTLDTASNVIGVIQMDTIAHPCVFVAHTGGSAAAFLNFLYGGFCTPSSGVLPVSGGITATASSPITPLIAGLNQPTFRSVLAGPSQNFALDGVIYPGSPFTANYPLLMNNVAFSIGPSYPLFINGAFPATPTCSVSAGGSVPVNSYTFKIVPFWWSGALGNLSLPSSTCTTSSGNQTVTINWTTVPGNPKDYRIYVNNNSFINSGSLTGLTQYVWSSAGTTANTPPAIPAGGPTMLLPGVQGISSGGPIIVNGHYVSGGAAPTCSVTGAGAGATCSVNAAWSDTAGQMIINTGTGPSSSGTITLTFSSSYSNTGLTMAQLAENASSWNARATLILSTCGGSSCVWNWDNNAVNLTASQSGSLAVQYNTLGK